MSDTVDILPECRAREPRNLILGPMGYMVPVFCANCGKRGPDCPEEGMTFAFYLCNPCFETHGAITATMVLPDEVFFAKVAEEQQEKFGRFLSLDELVEVVNADSSPLASLILRP